MESPARRLDYDYSHGDSVWNYVTSRRLKHNAVNHGQGFPNWAAPSFVKQAAVDAISENINQYTPNKGHPALVAKLAEMYSKKLHRKISARNIQPTNGCTGAFEAVCQAFLDEGDEVIAIEPFFDFYEYQLSHASATMRTAPLSLGKDSNGDTMWTFDPHTLRSVLNEKSRIFVLNTPHNPTGYVMNWDTMLIVGEILREFPRVIIAADEVYSNIIFDGEVHCHFANVPGMWERTITMNSAAKSFSVTGWKIGWVVGPANLVEPINFVTRAHSWCQPTPLQEALARVLIRAEKPYEGFSSYYGWLASMYTRKRNLMVRALKGAGFEPVIPKGSFYVCCKAKKLIEKTVGLDVVEGQQESYSDWRFVEYLIEKKRIAAIPFSAFVQSKDFDGRFDYIRFAFCVEDETILGTERTLSSLKHLLSKL